MKILQIRLQNINSIKGEHTLDFRQEPLVSAGLFAITGPTGSGKTTILDVITLALFNRIPRVPETITKSFIERTGLVLTRNMQEALAEVTYAGSQGIYTSRWSISRNRNGNLRDYEMQISDAQGNILDVRRTNVPDKNESLIGLSFDQFVKAIILAQGDFAAFLKAKGDEQGKLLEKVTGTWIYRAMGKAAYQKNKALGQELEQLQLQENARKDQLIPDEDYEKLVRDIDEADRLIAANERVIEQLKGEEKLKIEIAGLEKTVVEQETNLLVARGKQAAFLEQYGEPMKKHARLQPHQKNLWDWRSQDNPLNEQKNRLAAIEQQLLKCVEEDASIKNDVKTLTGSGEEVSIALEAFEKRVLDLQRRLAEAESLCKGIARDVADRAAEIPVVLDKKNPHIAARQLEEHAESNREELKRLKGILPEDALAEPDKKREELRKAGETLRSLIAESRLLQGQQQQLNGRLTERDELNGELEAIPGQLDVARSKQQVAELELFGLQKDRTIRDLTASLEEHRLKLATGEPCPLCGSTEHPYSAKLPIAQDDLDQKIENAINTNEALKKRVSTLETTLDKNQKSLEKLHPAITVLENLVKSSTEKVEADRMDLPENLRHEDTALTHDRVKQEMGDLESYIEAVQKEKKLKMLQEKVAEWLGYDQSVSDLSAALTALFPGKDVLAVTTKLRERFAGNGTRQENFVEEKNSLSEKNRRAQEDFTHLSNRLYAQLAEYSSPAEALKDLMEPNAYAELQSKEGKLKEDIQKLESGLGVHQGNLKGLREKDVQESLEEIKTLRTNEEARILEAREHRDGLKARQSIQKKNLQELEGLKVRIEEQKKQSEKWVLLSKYIGDAEGKRFSTFAQELTLLQLVQKANRRLEMLNDRYLLAIPAEAEDDSLAVIDKHMGDQRRSVKSLSGGETFLVSLSLALALSDLAARKVEIKSLFIDEGFGSLDKVTLDQTLDTLEKLQYETNKTIGVISHVEAMQERISTQIRLEKGGQGCSRLEVVTG